MNKEFTEKLRLQLRLQCSEVYCKPLKDYGCFWGEALTLVEMSLIKALNWGDDEYWSGWIEIHNLVAQDFDVTIKLSELRESAHSLKRLGFVDLLPLREFGTGKFAGSGWFLTDKGKHAAVALERKGGLNNE